MFRKMRRDKQELVEEECIDILNSQYRGTLAVMGDEGYPYAIPMNHIYMEGKLYFHAAKVGHKIDAIDNCDKVSYCVINDGIKEDSNWWYTFKSVIVFGRMSKISNPEKILEVLYTLGDKFPSTESEIQNEIDNYIDKVEILELKIEHMTGKVVTEK